MQTLEAILSFLFFFMFVIYGLSQLDYTKPNYELYRYQLANDIWRCLYLTGSLSYYPYFTAETEKRMQDIYDATGFCVYLEGIKTTINKCRFSSCSEDRITTEKIWFDNGIVDVMQFTVCVPK